MAASNKIQVGYIEAQDGAQFEVDAGTAAAPGLCFDDSAATGLYSPGTGQIAWSTSGKQTALRILADGKVGVDCTPTVALEVNGTIKASAIDAPIEGTLDDWIVHAGDTNTKIGFSANDTFQVHTGGSPRIQVTDSATDITNDLIITDKIVHSGDTDTAIRFPSNDNFTVELSGDEKFRLDGGQAKFKVGTNKTVKFYAPTHNDESDLGAGIGFSRVSDGAELLSGIFGHSNTGLGIAARDHVTILTGGTSNVSDTEERVRIASNGNVRIGPAGAPNIAVGGGLEIERAGAATIRLEDTGAGSGFEIQNTGGVIKQRLYNNQAWTIEYGGGEKFRIDSSGHITPGAAGTQDLGSTSKEWGNVYLADDKRLTLGSDQDMYVYHDNIHGYVSNRKANLYLSAPTYVQIISTDTSGSNVQTGATFLRGGKSEIYHSNSVKFETSSTGISVTGEVAATQDYPTIRPKLDFNFVSVKKLDSRVTFSRNSVASYTDVEGNVKLVGDNVPRFDHDPMTGESKGLLIEDARTNLVYPSTNWSVGNPGWTINNSNINVTINTTDTKDPAGTYNASKLVAYQGNTAMKDIWWTPSNLTFASGTAYAVSCFAKSTTGAVLQLRPRGQGSNKAWVNYNLSTGAVGSSGGSTLVSSKIEKYPNGWYRCSLVFTGSGTSGSGGLGTLLMYSATAGEASSNTGDESKSLYLWGVQHEVGRFESSYIPTSGTAASRNADFVSITGEEHTDFWNTSEGTYLIDYKPLEKAIGNGVIIGSKRGNNGSGYPWPLYRHDTANTNNFKSYDLTSSIVSMSTTWADQRESWALGFNGTNGSIARNGTQLQTNNTNMKGLIDANELWLGSSGTGSMYSMHVKRFMYYSKRITDSQLKTLTSQ